MLQPPGLFHDESPVVVCQAQTHVCGARLQPYPSHPGPRARSTRDRALFQRRAILSASARRSATWRPSGANRCGQRPGRSPPTRPDAARSGCAAIQSKSSACTAMYYYSTANLGVDFHSSGSAVCRGTVPARDCPGWRHKLHGKPNLRGELSPGDPGSETRASKQQSCVRRGGQARRQRGILVRAHTLTLNGPWRPAHTLSRRAKSNT